MYIIGTPINIVYSVGVNPNTLWDNKSLAYHKLLGNTKSGEGVVLTQSYRLIRLLFSVYFEFVLLTRMN